MMTCNQCGKQLKYWVVDFDYQLTDEHDHKIPVCKNPKCPNYALLQVPMEEMGKNKEKK